MCVSLASGVNCAVFVSADIQAELINGASKARTTIDLAALAETGLEPGVAVVMVFGQLVIRISSVLGLYS